MADYGSFLEATNAFCEDQNGAHVYTYERALFGYLAAGLMMVVPRDVINKVLDPVNLELRELGRMNSQDAFLAGAGDAYRAANPYNRSGTMTNLDMLRVMMLNYNRLINNNVDTTAAYLVAALRARWLYLGCLYKDRAARGVSFEEIVIIEDDEALNVTLSACNDTNELFDYARGAYPGLLEMATSGAYNLKWITNKAECIWAISEHMFRVRGHHYKEDHTEIIQRIYRANYEGNEELADNFPYAHVFHTSIHPFGIKALPIMMYHFVAHGRISQALIVRLSGAPNGYAAITTTSAALRMIAGEPWYAKFEQSYAELIAAAHDYAGQILNNKYSYHISASLYGMVPARTVTRNGNVIQLSVADAQVSALAPALQGFIDFVKSQLARGEQVKYSFANAMALQKRAAINPLLSMRISELIRYSIEQINNSDSVAEAIDTAFPVTATIAAGNNV